MIQFTAFGIPAPKGSTRKIVDDRFKAMQLCQSLCNPSSLQLIVIPGEPSSKLTNLNRTNGCGKPYASTKSEERKQTLRAWLGRLNPMLGNVAVACVFRRTNLQRIDVDNLLKAVLDAGTASQVWKDDCQVTAVAGAVEFDKENPRTIVCIAGHKSSLKRGKDALITCKACGKPFLAAGSRRREIGKWCSRECATYLAAPIKCGCCHKMFRRTNSYQKYCSEECRKEVLRVRNREASKAIFCKHGHPFDKENTYVIANGHRRCRKCNSINAARYRKSQRHNEKN